MKTELEAYVIKLLIQSLSNDQIQFGVGVHVKGRKPEFQDKRLMFALDKDDVMYLLKKNIPLVKESFSSLEEELNDKLQETIKNNNEVLELIKEYNNGK